MFYLILFFIFVFGLIIGSFLNCLIWRLRKKESLMGRSYCPKCKNQIAWYDNVPVLSFILLGGKCRHCHKPISWQYPVVELVTGILFVAAFIINFQFSISNFQTISNFQFPNMFIIQLFRDWFLIAVMIVIFIYDLRWYLILDSVVLPACLVVFIFNLMFWLVKFAVFWYNRR
jgi:prepilin signal peptidase PulO-like enzyme (type II secretory pathway)